MKKSWYTIKAQAPSDSVAEIGVHSDIGMWGVTAAEFLRDLKQIKAPSIHMTINSPGGSVSDAVAMFNGLRASGKHITVTVMGIAASAASFLALAGDKVVMPDNTMMMLHKPLTGMYGNADDLRKVADVLDQFEASVSTIYMTRWKGTEEELKQTLADETFLTAAECLERGLCDEVTSALVVEAKFDVTNLPENVQALFAKNEPAAAPELPVSLVSQIKQLAGAAGLAEFAAHFAADASLDSVERATKAIGDAREVFDLCALAAMPEQSGPLIRQRADLGVARKVIVEALARRDADAPVDTAAPSASLNRPTGPKVFDPIAIQQQMAAKQQTQRSK